MLEVYDTFDVALKAVLSKADPETLKCWELLDMENLPSWTNERLGLLGDAAHPYLPRMESLIKIPKDSCHAELEQIKVKEPRSP
jgi:hypothetical protein